MTALARWILKRLGGAAGDEMCRDLDEEYVRFVRPEKGRVGSALWYWGQVLRSVRYARVSSQRGSRATHRAGWLGALIQDSAYALRIFRKNPLFTAAAILTLTLGVGANTAIYSLVDHTVLRSLPYQDAERLVIVFNDYSGEGTNRGSQSVPELLDLRDGSSTFEGFLGVTGAGGILISEGEPQSVAGAMLSPSTFPLLGLSPYLGQGFLPEHESPDMAAVALLSYETWSIGFGRDSGVVGRKVILNGEPITIIGVMPREFRVPIPISFRPDLFLPLSFQRSDLPERAVHNLRVVGKLREGVSRAEVTAELRAVGRRMAEAYPNEYPDTFQFISESLQHYMLGDLRPALLLILGGVGLVLLIACANLANLLLSKGESRSREIAVRVAIGAGRGRVVRQLLTESIVLSTVGGVFGVLLAHWSTEWVLSLNPTLQLRLGDISMDWRILMFAAALTVATGLAFGLMPAIRSVRVDLVGGLKDGTRTSSYSGRLVGSLVVVQVMFAVVLASSAGLLVKSFWRLNQVDPGFRSEGLVTFWIPTNYPDQDQTRRFYRDLQEEVGRLPGVNGFGAALSLPLGGPTSDWPFLRNGSDSVISSDFNTVTPGFFAVMGSRIIEGREFDHSDREGAPEVVVISETLARQSFPDGALGKKIRMWDPAGGESPALTIVGVVEDLAYESLHTARQPFIYFPHAQQTISRFVPRAMTIVVRSSGDPIALMPSIRSALARLDDTVPVSGVSSMNDVVYRSMAEPRFAMTTFGLFGIVAVTLTAIGVYSVMSFSVSRRLFEIGLRMALGAPPAVVLTMVLRRGLVLTGAGLAMGLGVTLAATRLMESLLFQVDTIDPLTLLGVTALVVLVAVTAVLMPATRAARVDPVKTLRME